MSFENLNNFWDLKQFGNEKNPMHNTGPAFGPRPQA
jgi:hypothetical protein